MPSSLAPSAIRPGRHTARPERDFVLFLIGMRVNQPWRVDRWLPVARAMPRMLKELAAQPERGYLHGELWGGRTTLMLQYWRSLEALLAYAKDREAAHLPAWAEFNRRIGSSGSVGIWHETYCVQPGQVESIYVNMPPFALGRAAPLLPAQGPLATARGRMGAETKKPAPV